MEPASVSVATDEPNKKVLFDRSSQQLANCVIDDFHFEIRPAEDKPGFSVGHFEIHPTGARPRKFISMPFPTGHLTVAKDTFFQKGFELKKVNFVVKLENPHGLKLSDYFREESS